MHARQSLKLKLLYARNKLPLRAAATISQYPGDPLTYDGGIGLRFIFYTQKNHNFRICLPKKNHYFFLIYPKKSLSSFFHNPNKSLCFFSRPKNIPASFINPKKITLGKISDPKKSLGPPPPPLKYGGRSRSRNAVARLAARKIATRNIAFGVGQTPELFTAANWSTR